MTGRNESQGADERRANQGFSGVEFAGLGVQFAAAILIFVFAGVWLDRRLHSSPVFLLIGVFAGAGGGFFSMYRKVTAAQRRDAGRMKGASSSSGDGSHKPERDL